MSCIPIKLEDGSVILVNVKPGEKLTADDIEVLRLVFELQRKVHGKK